MTSKYPVVAARTVVAGQHGQGIDRAAGVEGVPENTAVRWLIGPDGLECAV